MRNIQCILINQFAFPYAVGSTELLIIECKFPVTLIVATVSSVTSPIAQKLPLDSALIYPILTTPRQIILQNSLAITFEENAE